MRLTYDEHAEAQELYSYISYVELLICLLFMTLLEGLAAGDVYTTAASRPGVPNPLPQAVAPKDLPVVVTHAGDYLVDNAEVQPSALEARLRGAREKAPELLVFIDGDARAPYGAVVRLEDVLDRLNINYCRRVNKDP